jgi:anti-sigma regulatory factor (Ser/Thr protein kinase)
MMMPRCSSSPQPGWRHHEHGRILNVTLETFDFAATADKLVSARRFMRRCLAEVNWSGQELDVLIAVGEVLQNIVRHGFGGGDPQGRIHMEISIVKGMLVVLIEDNAPPSLPSGWSSSERPAEDGGLGLTIINRIVAEVEFAPTATGNRARLRFHPG